VNSSARITFSLRTRRWLPRRSATERTAVFETETVLIGAGATHAFADSHADSVAAWRSAGSCT
jgi:hypothetical protein